MHKKAQASLEYLMTYAWAVLMILIAIGALAYFGVLDPSIIFPEKCIFTAGFNCVDFVVGEDAVGVMLENSLGNDIIVTSIKFSSDALSGLCETENIDALLRNGEKALFYANDPAGCSHVGGKKKSKYNVVLGYKKDVSGYEHNVDGELRGGYDPNAVIEEGEGYGGYSGNLVSYWKFDEGSGITDDPVADSAGDNDGTLKGFDLANFNDGTLENMDDSDWVDDFDAKHTSKFGKALNFDGSDDYVNAGSQAGLNFGTDDYSIEFWMKTSDNPAYRVMVGKFQDDNNRWYVTTRPEGVLYAWGRVTAGSFMSTTGVTDVLDDAWHHVVLVVDKGTASYFYVDGELDATGWADTGNYDNTGDLHIGDYANFYYYKGSIDEVRIYDKALEENEIQASMNSEYPVVRPVASWSFNEGSGTEAKDTHNWVKGNSGAALSFDGVDDYVEVLDDDSLDITDEITIEGWIKRASNTDYDVVISKYKDYGGGVYNYNYELILRYDADARIQFIYDNSDGTGGNQIFDKKFDNLNTWHHITIVHKDGEYDKLYFDGNPEQTITTDVGVLPINDINLRIGVRAGGTSNPFNGLIDEVRIWNKALSESEIQTLYAS